MKVQMKHRRYRPTLILALAGLMSCVIFMPGPGGIASAQVATPSWNYTGSLNAARALDTATLLPNGKVLVMGGRDFNPGGGVVNSAELYDSSSGTWTSAGVSTSRFAHTATLLLNGKVLVVGGYDGSRPVNPLNSAELYDPATGTWSITGNLNTPRAGFHTATLLPDGKVLVVGGIVDRDGHTTNSAELYDPATGMWTSTGSLNSPPSSTAMLPNGKVLVFDWDGSAELYDPATGTWSITVNPSPFRYSYTATLLQNGKVLLAGGFEYDCIGGCPSNSAELYDPATGTWTSTGNLNLARVGQTAMLLPSGKVLVFGGGNPGNSAELYDPATGTWSITASLNMARVAYTATLLSNGKVLVEGGNVSGGPGTLNTAELYDSGAESASTPTPTPTVTPTPTATPTATPTPTSTPAAVVSPSWTITGSLNTAHNFGHTATRLPNGKVLVAGGAGDSGSLNNTELYDPATGTWSTTGSLNTPRDSHTATLLQNGKVLVAGGFSCGPPPQVCSQLNSAELYDPVAGTWSSTGNLNTARDSHTATLLPNGIVLVAGGFLNGGELNSAELYDPATGIWTSTGNLNIGRYRYTTTLLQSGKVLVAGGVNSNGALNSAELYDPATGMWTSTGNLNTARELHTATLLYNGKVLVASGFVDFALGRVTNSAELYDPATGLWTMTGNLNQGRAFHTATLLTSGKVLVAGGFFVDGLPNITNSAELYDLATGTWSNTASLNTARRFHTATLLLNGEVLAAGGSGGNTAELYDTGINPIEDAPFFVRMQYLDFLGREPEPDGLQFYLDILNGCQPSDIECIKYTRGAISANFFRSPEFQRKGSFVMYLYMVSLGQRPVTPAELNDQSKIDRPHYGEFIADLQSISDPTDDPVIGEAKKVALTDAWMQRTEIQNKYGGLSNGAFVQKLLDTAGVTLANQSALVDDLNAARKTRAQVLRAIAESAEVNAKFYKQAFVTMEYFGYLRRDPESCVGSPDPANCGYIFHNSRFQLAADPDFLENTIVRGFIESPEYRQRFGQP